MADVDINDAHRQQLRRLRNQLVHTSGPKLAELIPLLRQIVSERAVLPKGLRNQEFQITELVVNAIVTPSGLEQLHGQSQDTLVYIDQLIQSEIVKRMQRDQNEKLTPFEREAVANPDLVLTHALMYMDVGPKRPNIQIVWDPEALSAEDYARLVTAIGDVVRAHGGAGLQFVTGNGFAVEQEELEPA